MAKKAIKIDTKTARDKAPESGKPHYLKIHTGLYLGFRKGAGVRKWVVRYTVSNPTNPKNPYVVETIRDVDDTLEGDADFRAAKAQAEAIEQTAKLPGDKLATGPVTVGTAVTAYIGVRDARDAERKGRAVRSDANQRLTRYVLSDAKLSAIQLRKIDRTNLATWRAGLPDTIKATTRRRLINDLKAALNAAVTDNRLPDAVKMEIREGLKSPKGEASSVARDPQILSDKQVADVIRVAAEIDPDVGHLVLVLAATGLRFSQVIRCRVCDLTASTLTVQPSRKGADKPDGKPITVPISATTYAALRAAADGRPGDAPLLERWRHVQTGPTTWERRDRGAWTTASELARPWAEIRKRVEGLGDRVPYSLRHTSIVRQIKARLPILTVAQQHNTSPVMIEKHYGVYLSDTMRDAIAAAAL